jgi:hypothetical protein
MIRNLKVLIAAAMGLAAFGAIGASGAQGAEFHCSVEPCTVTVLPDGDLVKEPKTAHQVFIITQKGNSVATTCNQAKGNAVITLVTKEATINSVEYHTCNVAGEPSTVRMNGCSFLIVTPDKTHDASVQIVCPAGKEIEIEVTKTGCLITIPASSPLSGIKLHDPKTGGKAKEIITAEPTVFNIPVKIANNKCPAPLVEGAALGDYTTGNVELTGETTPGGVMANLWWE